MAVTGPNLTIDVSTNSDCSELNLTDTTGNYPDVSMGYGLPSGPNLDDITALEVVVTFNSLSTSITYLFVITNQVITEATLSIGGGTPADILSELPSTVWPMTSDNPFNLVGDYGVTIPTFEDEVFKVEYTISGNVGIDPFEFSTTDYEPVVCHSRCCINRKFVALDPTCSCSDDKIKSALYGEALILQVEIASEAGDLTPALQALNELRLLCGQESDCGC